MSGSSGWNEYKKLILSEMEDNKNFRSEIRTILTQMHDDISTLKVKAAVAGGIAGMVGTGLLTSIISLWK